MTPIKPRVEDEAGPPKKPYETPRLEIYGDIHTITQEVGSHGKLDGGARPKYKTG